MNETTTYGSICTGYDGIGKGLVLAGAVGRTTWVAENEDAVARLLKRELQPDVPNLGDITVTDWRTVPSVQVMSSGDPCQSISIAGRREGRADPRFLWPWVRAAYRAVRPDVIFFENVANIVGHDGGRTLAERFAHLREDGYAVRWTVLGACAVGAPHHRHRWYAVATRVGRWAGVTPECVRVGAKALCGAPRSGGRRLLPTPDSSMSTRGGLLSAPMALKRLADPGRSSNLDDAVASLLPTPCARDGDGRGEGSVEFWQRREGRRGSKESPPLGAVVNLLPTPKASDGSNGGPNSRDGAGNYYLPGIAARPEVWGKYADAIALWEQITGMPAPEPSEPGTRGGRRLSAALPEWMMGLEPGFLTAEMTRPEALKAAGNGVVPLAAAAAWRMLS